MIIICAVSTPTLSTKSQTEQGSVTPAEATVIGSSVAAAVIVIIFITSVVIVFVLVLRHIRKSK